MRMHRTSSGCPAFHVATSGSIHAYVWNIRLICMPTSEAPYKNFTFLRTKKELFVTVPKLHNKFRNFLSFHLQWLPTEKGRFSDAVIENGNEQQAV
jgi:hypothetical protein